MNDYLNNPLLLIIDMQNVYKEGQPWECKNYDNALYNILDLLNDGHFSQDNTILTRYIASAHPTGVWKNYNKENAEINANQWYNDLDQELQLCCKDYKCYDKSTYSSYSIKEIQEAANNASSVVITGVVAECCVLVTVSSLIDAGKYVYYITDAVAGLDNEKEEATIKVLEGLTPLHLSIMTTKEFKALTQNNTGLSKLNLF